MPFPSSPDTTPISLVSPDAREQFELDTVRIDIDLDLRVQIFAFAVTYGLTERLDVGILVPITSVDMQVQSQARIAVSPRNTLFPEVHAFEGGPESPRDAASGHAFGLGDIVLRAKYHLLKSEAIDISGAVLTRLATGDHRDFLGSGATTVRPFVVLSRTLFDLVTPHLNLGYEFNVDRGHQSGLQYALGVDVGTGTWTVAGELLGSHEPDGDGIGDNILTGSLGVKWNPWKQLLVFTNAQVPLNRKSGLRSDLVLTFGAEYNF
jgi:hypothetical protein